MNSRPLYSDSVTFHCPFTVTPYQLEFLVGREIRAVIVKGSPALAVQRLDTHRADIAVARLAHRHLGAKTRRRRLGRSRRSKHCKEENCERRNAERPLRIVMDRSRCLL